MPPSYMNGEDIDKENCPPLPINEDDDLAHLFEESPFSNKTPTKGVPFQDLLKTPTLGSHRRTPLTPKRGTDNAELKTPSRNILNTPNRSGRAATVAPETPFTRQLNALLSDCLPGSPSHAIDFSVFPAFNTPGRATSGTQFGDFMNDDFLSSDLQIPSSPPQGLGFSLYEDPATSTVGLWSGASIFNSDPIRMEDEDGNVYGGLTSIGHGGENETRLKIDGLSVDFAAIIEQVVATANQEADTGLDAEATLNIESANVSVDKEEIKKKELGTKAQVEDQVESIES